MGDESWRDGSVVQRHLHLLNTELKADCTFVVGISEKKQFQCHKSILSYGSPVFDAMFNGDLEEKGEVKVEDIEPQNFRKILEYIYSDNTELENVETALSVCYAANKYMINTLTLKCIEFIKENLNVDTVCRALEFARLIDNTDLEAESLQYLKIHTGDVLKSASFPNAERATLLTILDQDYISITSEVEVFSACIRWAKAQPRDTTVTLRLREVLGPDALSLIRFLTMTPKQFVTFVVPTKLLNMQEERDILCCLAAGTGNMPEGFSNNSKNRVAYGPKETIEILTYSMYSCSGKSMNTRPFRFRVNVESYIFGLELHGLAGKRCPAVKFEDNFSVNLLQNSEILAIATFKGLMSHGTFVQVNFNSPHLLKANTQYTLQMRYSSLNAQYRAAELDDVDDKTTSTGVKMTVDFYYTTISKIFIAKKI